MAASTDFVWSFGYGSNMDVKALEAKKHVKILEHCPAILPNFRLAFNLKGIPHAEPVYANIVPEEGCEVHGVAFCMTADSGHELEKTESGYNKTDVVLKAYDGRELQGFVFTSKTPSSEMLEISPSKRYLGVLCKGAKQAGLKTEYIDKLSRTSTYEPPEWVIEARARRPDVNDLPDITVDELAKHGQNSDEPWISVLGFVIRPLFMWFSSHKGRDITSRMLMHFHGIPMDDNDDRGKPPYPLVKDLSNAELEYITSWMDHYLFAKSEDGKANIGEFVGYLKEFKQQQESGQTTFVLPVIPE